MSFFSARIAVNFFGIFLIACPLMAQGVLFPWNGPVSRSMGGAITATSLDPMATTYWNPAAMADTNTNQIGFGVDLVNPQISTTSSFAGFGQGTSDGEPGWVPLPSLGWIFHSQRNCNITYGLSIASVGGAKTNYPASFTNPLFLPQSNTPGFPGGLGRINTAAQFLQLMPSVCFRLTENWSVAVAPTITMGQLDIDPFMFASPDDADFSGQPRYPMGSGAHMNWGGGFQLSSYFRANEALTFGATYRSKQWMEPFDNTGVNELGLPRDLTANFELPMLISVGTAYSGFTRTLISMDARFVGNSNADGWGGQGFNPDGSLIGLGFRDQYLLAAGIRRRMTDRFTMAGGYTFCSSILSDDAATIGVLAPLHYQHVYHLGGTIHLNSSTDFNFAYGYSPVNELSGPIVSPFGPIPGTNVTTQLSVHAISFGVSVFY